jgi:hypothetical protein
MQSAENSSTVWVVHYLGQGTVVVFGQHVEVSPRIFWLQVSDMVVELVCWGHILVTEAPESTDATIPQNPCQ